MALNGKYTFLYTTLSHKPNILAKHTPYSMRIILLQCLCLLPSKSVTLFIFLSVFFAPKIHTTIESNFPKEVQEQRNHN